MVNASPFRTFRSSSASKCSAWAPWHPYSQPKIHMISRIGMGMPKSQSNPALAIYASCKASDLPDMDRGQPAAAGLVSAPASGQTCQAGRALYSASVSTLTNITIPRCGKRQPDGSAAGDLEDGLALKGHSPTAAIPGDSGVRRCVAGSRVRRFFTSEASTSERHDDTLSPLSDHTRQFKADPLLGRNGDRLAIDELAQYLDFQITQLHRWPLRLLDQLSSLPVASLTLPASSRLHPVFHRSPTLPPLAKS
jgi:hypothetical protein